MKEKKYITQPKTLFLPMMHRDMSDTQLKDSILKNRCVPKNMWNFVIRNIPWLIDCVRCEPTFVLQCKWDQLRPVLEQYLADRQLCLRLLWCARDFIDYNKMWNYLLSLYGTNPELYCIFTLHHAQLSNPFHGLDNPERIGLLLNAIAIGESRLVHAFFKLGVTLDSYTQVLIIKECLLSVNPESYSILKFVVKQDKINDIFYTPCHNQKVHEIVTIAFVSRNLHTQYHISLYECLCRAIQFGTRKEVTFILAQCSNDFKIDAFIVRKAFRYGRLDLLPNHMKICDQCRFGICSICCKFANIYPFVLEKQSTRLYLEQTLFMPLPLLKIIVIYADLVL